MKLGRKLLTHAFVAAALLLTLCPAGLVWRPVAAADKAAKRGKAKPKRDKVSPDLRARLRGREFAEETVEVVLQLSGKPRGLLNALLNRNGVHVNATYESFDSLHVSLPPSVVEELATFEEVEIIAPDRAVERLGFVESATGAAEMRRQSGNSGLKGKDMNIAVLDSGVDKDHHGVGSRVELLRDFTGENRTDDPYGHGTHVASLAAGTDHVAHGAYVSPAPEAKIISLRVLNAQGFGRTSDVLRALQWILAPVDPNRPGGEKNHQKYRIRVVNMSLGTLAVDSYRVDPLCVAVRKLVDAGIVVVAAAGNDGTDASGKKIYGRIHSPGNEPAAITVGASNTFDTQSRADDVVTSFSSRGPTRSFWTDDAGARHYDHVLKPDLVAPGNKVIAAQAKSNDIVRQHPRLGCTPGSNDNHKMMVLSGSSMATPLVAGAAALVLQANPKLTPNLVKMIFQYTAQPLANFNTLEQGAGQLNIEGAMRLAKLVRTDLTAQTAPGTPLLTAQTLPTPFTTLDGHTFPWAQGVVLRRGYATGTNLIAHYHPAYGLGIAFGDGIVITDGIAFGDLILTSNGMPMGTGIAFGDGIVITDGIAFGDGVAFGDGILVGDGIVITDGILVGDAAAWASHVMSNGDATSGMPVVYEDGTTP